MSVDRKELNFSGDSFTSLNVEGGAKLVTSGIDELADAMAQWSVAPTPLPSRESFPRGDEEIVALLSRIRVNDKNLSSLNLDRPTDEDLVNAAALTLAKSKVLVEKVKPDERGRFDSFRRKILLGIGNGISKVGGKKGVAFASAVSLVTAACSPAISSEVTPNPTEQPLPVSTKTIFEPTKVPPTPTEEPIEQIPLEAVLMLENLGEGFELQRDGENLIFTNSGQFFARMPLRGLEAKLLEDGKKIYTGVEVELNSQDAQKLPGNSEFVLDNLGHLSVLNEGRTIGVYYENELVIMPGLERWGADELQVVIDGFRPKVTSLHGTELYRYIDGEWKSVLQPGLSTYFIYKGQTVTTGHFLTENTPFQARSNVGEFGNNAQAVVLFDNPQPYIYDAPWNDAYDEIVIEGVILSPDGRPSLIRVPLTPAGSTDDIRVLRRSDITGGPEALRWVTKDELQKMPIDEYVELINRKVYGYVFMEFGLIEERIHPDYVNHPLYEWYRDLVSNGKLDFLEDPNKPSPYVVPLRFMSLVLDGEGK